MSAPREASPPDVERPGAPSGGEYQETPIWDELLASMPAEQIAALRVAVRGEIAAALRLDVDRVGPRLTSALRKGGFIDAPDECFQVGERLERVGEQLVGVDVPGAVVDRGEELAGDDEFLGEAGGHGDEVVHDSPSVGPGAGTLGGEPAVGVAGDTSGGVGDSAVGRVTEGVEEDA